ncbi:MAG TPA: hypothetical protein VFX59_00585 [Polyangiales bacterium]|nr:hypothetical protein [Polyangiales bacterium]
MGKRGVAWGAAALLALVSEAEAAPECTAPIFVWELQLEQVAADEGQPDLQAIATALGTQATLRGGWIDPARPREPVRIDLVGSTDGVGLTVRAEQSE